MPKYADGILAHMRFAPLILAALALALVIVPTLAADVTVPINQDHTESDGMVIHILRADITDRGMGNVYSPDPDHTIWPKLVYTFENKGTTANYGDLEMAFFDDKGNQYPAKSHITDITMNKIEPGKTSDVRFVEAAVIPKDTKIAYFKVYEGGRASTYDIPYDKATTATAGATSTTGPTATPICGILLVLPLIAIGVVMARRLKR